MNEVKQQVRSFGRKFRKSSNTKEPSTSDKTAQRWRIKALRIDGIPPHHTQEVVVQSLELIIKDLSSLVRKPECRSLAYRDKSSSTATATFETTLEADELASRLEAAASGYGYLFTNQFDGITPLFDGFCSPVTKCSEIKCNPKVDVVAVPGLSCHILGSWKSSDDKQVWLRDFLPHDVPHARILLYGYDTALEKSLKHHSIGDLGSDFWETLSAFRNNDNTHQRPIVFIGHSLGGLVIKEALVHAGRKMWNSKMNSPFVCAGLVFFGVPNLGIRHDELNTVVDGQANADLMHDLVVDRQSEPSNYIKKLNEQFRDLCKGSFQIAAFYERELSPTLVKDESSGRWERNGPLRMLVTRESAVGTGLVEQTEPIACNNKNHRGLVKLDNHTDRVYWLARDRLLKMISTPARVAEGSSVSRFDIEACLKSLAFQDMNSRKHNIKLATQGTFGWLQQHKAWLRWWKERRSLLWVQGKPGSGKSTLMYYAVQKLEPDEADDTILISFFIHGRGEALQKTQLGLYRSVVHQLLSRVPEAFAKLIGSFTKHRKEVDESKDSWTWTIPLLQDHLQTTLINVSKSRRIIIFLDALDEAGRGSAVEIIDFFRQLTEAHSSEGNPFHICFSCRYHPDLKDDDGLEIRLDKENRKDINTFCRTKLNRRLYKEMGELLTERSEGVFIWVRLVVERVKELDRNGDSTLMIRDEVQRTPQEIEELYGEIVQRDLRPSSDIQLRSESLRLFRWVCFSERSLKRDELPWALAMGTCDDSCNSIGLVGDAPRFIAPDRLDKKIKSLSCGLIEFTAGDTERQEMSVAQFIHQTAKDYLINRGLSYLEDSILHHVVDLQPDVRAQLQLSQDCLRYVRLVALAEASAPSENGEDSYPFLRYTAFNWAQHFTSARSENGESSYPFLGYAAFHWAQHFTGAEKVQSHADEVFDLFMQPPDHFFHAWSLPFSELDYVTNVYQFSCRHGLTSLLNHASECCEDPEQWIDMPNKIGRTPLSLAAWRGHSAVVQRLIDMSKASLDVPDKYGGQTPLSRAIEYGHDSTVQLLIKAGSDIEAKDGDGQTPLSWAAEEGHEYIVQLLIKAGADIEAKDKRGRTPLLWATQQRYDSVVQLLITAGANTEIKNEDGQTPLSRAARRGYDSIVHLLIKAGADIETKDERGWTPLSWAARTRQDSTVQLLIKAGATTIASGASSSAPLD